MSSLLSRGRAGARRVAAIVALLAALTHGPAAGLERGSATGPTSIEVQARVINSFKPNEPELRRFGHLEFRGGLELTSSYRGFGGLSALQMRADGRRFVAITDKGNWLTGRIVYEGAQPVGIAEATMAPMLDAVGFPLAKRGWYDTEALADDGQGALYVGIERVNRIVRFDFARYGVSARAEPVGTPPHCKHCPTISELKGSFSCPKACQWRAL